ncbi:hypothetical protein TSTA_111040 [Talaromyces stipitatus ATCC 10500]|uniref:NACHT domain-containing protein n=1 Tax=Talaromyces stipitatus (strain ATCC 10500 / CBS 375.48 / QM 6759 / NRRL 1006) TaxID=441959 RepID=B8MU71_TALSN|nr:uncharacterized protein TSTA_111040 [Talaromyces stipitatus ATCC 10500]EED11927.1 hypothetical protein TSTA_111040 [Talaromyces stipitatus ATCC 10500]
MAESPLYLSRPTCTNNLISRLTSFDRDPKERNALEAVVSKMIEIFKDDRKLLYVPEVAELSSAVSGKDYLELTVALSNTVIKGTSDGSILDEKLLTNYAYFLRRANGSLSPATTVLGSVLMSLQKRLDEVIKQARNGTQYQLQLVSTVSAILDAMVDLKIYGLDRVDLYEPLQEQLKSLMDHQELRLAQAATYSREALLGLPNNESSYHAFLRHACAVARGAAGVAGAVPTMDPAKLMDAIPDLMNVPDLIKSVVDVASDFYNIYDGVGSMAKGMKRVPKQKSWYVSLRYTDMLIRSAAWQKLEEFIREVPCGREETFLCGLYAQLEQAWIAGDSSIRDRVVDSIQRSISQVGPKHHRAQEWVKLIADTVGRPSWKNSLPSHRHILRIRKNQKYEPKLKMFPIEIGKTGNLPRHLLNRAWSECDEAQKFYADAFLREYYTQGRLKIKRLSEDLLDMEQCYINLAVIELSQNGAKRQLDNEKTEQQPLVFTLFTWLKVEVGNTEIEVKLPNLFKDQIRPDGTMSRPKRILIRGRAGVGKTTLCKKIVHDFLYKKMWEELFDRIFWIPLRSLRGKSSLEELLSQEYFSTQREPEWLVQALWRGLGDEKNERTLLLLDSLDKISGERSISGTDLTKKFRGLLNRHNVIITSQPYAINIPGHTPFDLELETIGFHRDQVQAYITKVVDKTDAEAIWSFIQGHWLIQGLVQIPIQLDALCYSWDSDLRSRGVPETMTALYKAIELRLWKKDILQLKKGDGRGGLLSKSQVQKLQIHSQIEFLAEKEIELVEFFAFTGLYNDIIEFDIRFRSRIYTQPSLRSMSDDELDRLSFLRTSDPSSERKDRIYNFIHLTFQEYFAAQYFVRRWISRQPLQCLTFGFQKNIVEITPERLLQQEKYSGRYDVFWRFVAGLLQSQDEEQLCRFFQLMEDKPHDFLGPAHQRILMHCFGEVPPNSGLENLRTLIEAQLKQWALFEYKLRGEMTLCREMEFPNNVLISMMNEGEPKDVKNAILQALRHRSNFSVCLVNLVAYLLGQNVSSDLEWFAINALGRQTSLPDNILQAIVRRLEHSEWYIRQSAIDALDKQACLSDDILQAIVHCLEDFKGEVRESAINTLGKQTSLPDNILQAIVHRLEHSEWYIRQSTIYVFGKQTSLSDDILQAIARQLEDSEGQSAIDVLHKQTSLSDGILQAIVCQLEDSEGYVRQSAIDALDKQISLSDDILQAIVCRLEDSDSYVRWSAINALDKQTALSDNILQATVRWLEHSEGYVRQSAINVLDKQTTSSDNIFQAIVRRLEDSDEEVRRTAIDALDKQTVLSDDILQTIVRRLKDSNRDVRRSAINVLDKQTALSDDIFQAIVCRLEDSEGSVRLSAIYILGKQTSLLDDILQAIVLRLEDSEGYVRQSAIDVLDKQTSLSDDSLQAIVRRLEDSDSYVRQSAIDALGKQTSLSDDILLAIVRRLEHSEWYVRQSAINVFGKQTSLSDNILQAIMHQLEDSEGYVRQSTIDALGKQTSLSDDILQAIVRRLEHSEGYVRHSAISALGAQTSLSDDILQAIVRRLEDSKEYVRWSALYALDKQTTLSDDSLQAIVHRLEDSNRHVRHPAIYVFGKQTSLSDDILQAIARRLEDSDESIRWTAIDVLGKQTVLSDDILQAIVRRLEDSNGYVRQSANYALNKQITLSDNILQAIVRRLEHSEEDVRQSAIDALDKQTSLSDDILQSIVLVLSKNTSSTDSESVSMLLKQDNLYDSFQNFDVETLRSLYRLLVQQSFSEHLSCYMQDETFYINMPDRQKRVSLVQSKDVFLDVFRDEAVALGRPLTASTDDLRLR